MPVDRMNKKLDIYCYITNNCSFKNIFNSHF